MSSKTGEGREELPVIFFESQQAWEEWLEAHHAESRGIRLQMAKKGSGIPSITYDEALEIALCYGWIDSRKEAWDETYWIQRFGPRGPRSIWSKINKEKAERLVTEGRMKPAGLAAIEEAKRKGQWEQAYASQSRSQIPEDLERKFEEHPDAAAFFATLDSRNKYAVIFRVQSAKKPETRAKRIDQFIDMLEKGEKIYP